MEKRLEPADCIVDHFINLQNDILEDCNALKWRISSEIQELVTSLVEREKQLHHVVEEDTNRELEKINDQLRNLWLLWDPCFNFGESLSKETSEEHVKRNEKVLEIFSNLPVKHRVFHSPFNMLKTLLSTYGNIECYNISEKFATKNKQLFKDCGISHCHLESSRNSFITEPSETSCNKVVADKIAIQKTSSDPGSFEMIDCSNRKCVEESLTLCECQFSNSGVSLPHQDSPTKVSEWLCKDSSFCLENEEIMKDDDPTSQLVNQLQELWPSDKSFNDMVEEMCKADSSYIDVVNNSFIGENSMSSNCANTNSFAFKENTLNNLSVNINPPSAILQGFSMFFEKTDMSEWLSTSVQMSS